MTRLRLATREGHRPVASQDRARAAVIVTRWARSTLDYFKLWPDKAYVFSPSGTSVIAYRTAWSVAVGLGDPVGPEGELADLVASFARFCADRGWRVAFHQVRPELVPMYRRQGLRVLKIGEEAMVDRGYLARHPLVIVRDPGSRPVAFLNEVPAIRPEVATVDLMRHRRQVPNGLMDYLFAELMLRRREEGTGGSASVSLPWPESATAPAPAGPSGSPTKSTSTRRGCSRSRASGATSPSSTRSGRSGSSCTGAGRSVC